jgi:phosphopantothenoylcysteine decarboxylase/phosphopantothenate--cysteine ligase
MNTNMYKNPIVQANIINLQDCGYYIMEPDSGLLANGDVGIGRLPDIEAIYKRIIEILQL